MAREHELYRLQIEDLRELAVRKLGEDKAVLTPRDLVKMFGFSSTTVYRRFGTIIVDGLVTFPDLARFVCQGRR